MTTDTSDPALTQDAVDLLINQHTRIRDLFGEVESSTGQARRDAFHRLVWLLAVHETAEQHVVHPLTRSHVDGGDDIVADRLAEEHHVTHALLALEQMGTDAPEFPRLLTELRLRVLEHANHEEAYEFRYLRRDVPAPRLHAMAPVIQAAEAAAPQPRAGVETADTPTWPAPSLFDRTKDLVRNAISLPGTSV